MSVAKILDDIVYGIFIHNFELYDNDNGKKKFKTFREDAMKEHCGDCTWEPMPCSRCTYEDYFQEAKEIFQILYDRHGLGR